MKVFCVLNLCVNSRNELVDYLKKNSNHVGKGALFLKKIRLCRKIFFKLFLSKNSNNFIEGSIQHWGVVSKVTKRKVTNGDTFVPKS